MKRTKRNYVWIVEQLVGNNWNPLYCISPSNSRRICVEEFYHYARHKAPHWLAVKKYFRFVKYGSCRNP